MPTLLSKWNRTTTVPCPGRGCCDRDGRMSKFARAAQLLCVRLFWCQRPWLRRDSFRRFPPPLSGECRSRQLVLTTNTSLPTLSILLRLLWLAFVSQSPKALRLPLKDLSSFPTTSLLFLTREPQPTQGIFTPDGVEGRRPPHATDRAWDRIKRLLNRAERDVKRQVDDGKALTAIQNLSHPFIFL